MSIIVGNFDDLCSCGCYCVFNFCVALGLPMQHVQLNVSSSSNCSVGIFCCVGSVIEVDYYPHHMPRPKKGSCPYTVLAFGGGHVPDPPGPGNADICTAI